MSDRELNEFGDKATGAQAIVPRFFMHTELNETKSKEQGRAIYDEYEACEIRFAGNRQTVLVAPAVEVWKMTETGEGMREPVTYAMRFPDQYKKFKAGEMQVLAGTPLSELPFLTAGKRLELKALNIHTAEALAGLDGKNLQMLGIGGREWKNQATEWLKKAAGSSDVTRLAAENTALREAQAVMQTQIEELMSAVKGKKVAPPVAEVDDEPADIANSPFNDWSDEDLKAWIADADGARPKGNPSHATLVRQASAINDRLNKVAEQQAA